MKRDNHKLNFKNPGRWASGILLLLASIPAGGGCLQNYDDGNGFLESGVVLLATAPAQLYTGLSDIPTVVTQSATNASTLSTSLFTEAFTHSPASKTGGFQAVTSELDVGSNTTLQGITTVFNPVKDVIRGKEGAVTFISNLIRQLKSIEPGTQILQGTDTWEGQAAKFQYQADTTHGAGGKKLEVWWNNAAAPYNNLKALELRFRDLNSDTGTDQNINGEIWARVPNDSGTTLFTVHIDFDYTAASGVRSMSVVLQNTGANADENGHFYVRTQDGITSLDGTFTVPNHSDGISGASASRAYVFTAAGSDTAGRAVIKSAFPLATSTNINPYGTGQLEAFAEIWTDWFLSVTSVFNFVTQAGLPTACTSLTQPSSANPATASGSSAAQLLACLDAVRVSDPTAGENIYFVPFIQNPAYFTLVNNVVTLETVGTAPTGDTSYDQVAARTLSTVRTTGDSIYAADFTPNAVNNLDILTGTNLPATAHWTTNDTAPF